MPTTNQYSARLRLPVLPLFFILALIYLLPLPLHFTTHVPGDNGDSVTNLWSFWYYPNYLAGNISAPGSTLFHSTLQLAPRGIDLVYTSSSPIGAIAMAPIALLVSPAAALNAWLLLQLTLGGWFFFRLARTIGAARWPAFLAGTAYQWSPFVAVHLPGHYSLVQIAFPAAALWTLAALARVSVSMENHPPRRHLALTVLALGAACWAVAISDFYLAVMTVLLLLALLAHLLLTTPGLAGRRTFWFSIAGAAAITTLALTPWAWLVVQARHTGDYSALRPDFGSRNVATWTRLVNLPAWHSVWGPRIYPEYKDRLSSFNEYAYIGIVSLAVAFIGLLYVKSWRAVTAWVIAFFVVLGLAGANYYSAEPAWPTGPLSFGKWWPRVFPFTEFRVPGRWQFALCTIVAVLLALGSQALLDKFRRPALRHVAALLLLAAILFDTMRWPLPLMESTPPASGLRADSSAGTLLDFPFGIISGQGHSLGDYHRDTLLRQMQHRRPLLSANVSRLANDAVNLRQADPEFSALVAIQAGDKNSTSPEDISRLGQIDWRAFAQRYHITAIRIPNDYPTSSTLKTISDLMHPWHWQQTPEALIGQNPVYP